VQRPSQRAGHSRGGRARTDRVSVPGFPAGRGFRNIAHIIGVVVREIASDTRMAVASVTVNSRNSRPTMPPMSSIGMKTAIKERTD